MAGRLSEDRGDTFIEVLVALTILSIGISALMYGLATSITTSVTNRSQSEALTALNAAAEYVKGMAQGTACAATSDVAVPTSEVTPPADFSLWYGPISVIGTEPCSAIVKVPVRVEGQGFETVHVVVVKRG